MRKYFGIFSVLLSLSLAITIVSASDVECIGRIVPSTDGYNKIVLPLGEKMVGNELLIKVVSVDNILKQESPIKNTKVVITRYENGEALDLEIRNSDSKGEVDFIPRKAGRYLIQCVDKELWITVTDKEGSTAERTTTGAAPVVNDNVEMDQVDGEAAIQATITEFLSSIFSLLV